MASMSSRLISIINTNDNHYYYSLTSLPNTNESLDENIKNNYRWANLPVVSYKFFGLVRRRHKDLAVVTTILISVTGVFLIYKPYLVLLLLL